MTDSPRPPSRPVDLTTGDPLAALHAWVGDGRVDEAARARARQHWLERQAAEDATLLATLLDLAERGEPVVITTQATKTIAGSVSAVGADFVVVRGPARGDAFVPVDRLAVVRTTPGAPPPVGDRPVGFALTFGSALLELAPDRPSVVVSAGDDIRGSLVAVGRDVVTLALDGDRRDHVHVRLGAIDHFVLLDR